MIKELIVSYLTILTKNAKGIFAATALLSVFVSGASQAAAPQQEVYQLRGLGVTGNFYTYDGCFYRGVEIASNQNTTHLAKDGKPTTVDFLSIGLYSFNYCTGEFTSAWGYVERPVLSGGMNAAVVSDTLLAYDYLTGQWHDVVVNLTFNSNGDYSSHGINSYSYSFPGVMSHTRYSGATSAATISGTMTVDGVDVFATASSQSGSIFTANSGTSSFYRF